MKLQNRLQRVRREAGLVAVFTVKIINGLIYRKKSVITHVFTPRLAIWECFGDPACLPACLPNCLGAL